MEYWQCYLVVAWVVPPETAAVSAQVLCTPFHHALCHFMQSHICKVYACLSVTCHLHFWQNDWDLLRATAVTRGWNGYRNKSQHRKLTLEKKIIPPLQQGFEPETFQSRVRRSSHRAIPVNNTTNNTRIKNKSVNTLTPGWAWGWGGGGVGWMNDCALTWVERRRFTLFYSLLFVLPDICTYFGNA